MSRALQKDVLVTPGLFNSTKFSSLQPVLSGAGLSLGHQGVNHLVSFQIKIKHSQTLGIERNLTDHLDNSFLFNSGMSSPIPSSIHLYSFLELLKWTIWSSVDCASLGKKCRFHRSIIACSCWVTRPPQERSSSPLLKVKLLLLLCFDPGPPPLVGELDLQLCLPPATDQDVLDNCGHPDCMMLVKINGTEKSPWINS